MSDHSKFVALSLKLIQKHGRIVTFVKPGASVYVDENKKHLGRTQVEPVKFDAKALITSFEDKPENQDRRERGVKKVLVPPYDDFDLRDFDTFIDGGEVFALSLVTPVQPGEQIVLFKCEAVAS